MPFINKTYIQTNVTQCQFVFRIGNVLTKITSLLDMWKPLNIGNVILIS